MTLNGKKFIFPTLLALGIVIFSSPKLTYAEDCDNIQTDTIEHTQDKVKCLTDKVGQLGSQANTLKNQIVQFDYQIKLTTLKISQTEAQINLLGGRIDQLEVSLQDLTKAFSSRAVETYKLSKFENNFFFILSAPDVKNATSRFHYLQKIQEEDRSLLTRLTEAQTVYQGQKQDQETLQKQLAEQKAKVNTQKVAKNNLLMVTKNDEAKYQNLLSLANSQLSKFRNFTVSHGGSAILDNQTKCNEGWSGCYYNQRDSQWGNMSLGGTNYLMKDSGCFVTSVAMVASHYGKNIKPNDIAALSIVFTNQGDLKWQPFNANGVSVSIGSDSISSLDKHLLTGPVIVGVNGNSHFIVILRKEGSNYVMNDPFIKDGYNKPFSDGGYSISSLRLISFN